MPKIRNPATGRMVDAHGKIGRQIMAQYGHQQMPYEEDSGSDYSSEDEYVPGPKYGRRRGKYQDQEEDDYSDDEEEEEEDE